MTTPANYITEQDHRLDDQGRPAGGRTLGIGMNIEWQNGPLGRGDERMPQNGAFVEGVIEAALGRLDFYQSTPFACPENAAAIVLLMQAIEQLNARTNRREFAGTEGTHQGN